MRKNQHVVKKGKQWLVKSEGTKTPTESSPYSGQSPQGGYSVCEKEKAEVVIHRADGTIRDKNSYGDESRKRDRKH